MERPSIYRIVYMSTAVRPFSCEELESLLAVSRRNNTGMGVTGLLVYKDQNFLQTLEGDQATVERLYSKIMKDDRHEGCTTFVREFIPAREFPDWSMGFRDLRQQKVPVSAGFNDILQTGRGDISALPKKVRAFTRMFVT